MNPFDLYILDRHPPHYILFSLEQHNSGGDSLLLNYELSAFIGGLNVTPTNPESRWYLNILQTKSRTLSAYISPTDIIIIIVLHQSRNNDVIRECLQEIYAIYARLVLNPFFDRSEATWASSSRELFASRVESLIQNYVT